MSTNRIALHIPGRPVGKGRARSNRKTGHHYTPAATVSAEQRIQGAWIAAGRPTLGDGAIQLRVTLWVDRPKAHFKRDGSLSAEGKRRPIPLVKPDTDNAVKLVMDALNGMAYKDDVQIADHTVSRQWSITGAATTIVLRPLTHSRGVTS